MSFDGRAYQARVDALAASGADVHGEADLVRRYGPASVYDAGCGTGRVAIELARHGIEVLGVDADASMIAEARRRAPGLGWVHADVARYRAGRSFDVAIMAGNVPLFCPPADRDALVGGCAAHLVPGGRLIAGFTVDHLYPLAEYDRAATAAGLGLEDRWSTWAGDPWSPDADYAVSVHRAPLR